MMKVFHPRKRLTIAWNSPSKKKPTALGGTGLWRIRKKSPRTGKLERNELKKLGMVEQEEDISTRQLQGST